MEYTSPGVALSEGLRSGLGLAANFQALKQQREQQKWERELQVAEMGMKLSGNKNLPLDQRMNAFNKGVRPVLSRMGIEMPEMTAATANSNTFQDAVKNSNGIIDQMQSGDLSPQVGMKAITQHFTGALKDMDAETSAETTQRELIIGNAKQYVDRAEKAAGKATDNTPSPAEAIKRQTELQLQLANLNKTDMNSQITADALKKAGFNVEAGKITPDMVEMVKQGVRKELSFMNQFLPDEYRHKEGITLAEAKALKEKGFTRDRMARDFFVKDAPGGMDPLSMKPPQGAKPMPGPGAAAIPAGPAGSPRPVTPPPMAMPTPMAAPAPTPTPMAGPLSLSGGSTKPTQAGPLQLQEQPLR